jgi:REP element-mobilizing transposase RayT
MAQSLSKVLLHLVFSTKRRRPSIPQDLAADLYAYLAGAVRALGGEAYRVGGTEDPVHLACSLPRTLTVSKLLEEIKKSSSAWLKTRDTRCHGFSWQAGYGAFSFGQSQLDSVVRYIASQQEHHRSRTFQEELREILERYGVDYEERYLWD